MNIVRVRNLEIGSGIPKICVPIVGRTKEEILAEAGIFSSIPADLAEWRADWFDDVFDFEKVTDILTALRNALGDTPLLVSFRTANEGGERAISDAGYLAWNQRVIQSGCADLIDAELFRGELLVRELIAEAHQAGVKVIVSNHDFEKTPEQNELLNRLKTMQQLGADLPKIAVMPQSKKDVLTLLAATEEMTRLYADRPIITMSMAASGVISRLCGEVFGSALTFGAAKKASAPGQMGVTELDTILTLLHKAL